jgi:hypothetical protein
MSTQVSPPTSAPAQGQRRDPSHCRAAADIYGVDSRKLIGRIAAPFLDDARVTPIELLHGYQHALALANAGTTLTAFVQQTAITQVKASGQAVSERVRELFTYTDAAVQTAKVLSEAAAAAPALTAERLAELAAAEDIKPAYAALTHHLNGAAGWDEKILRIFPLCEGAAEPALRLLDQLLSELLARPPAIARVIGEAATTVEARIMLLIALARREVVPAGEALHSALGAMLGRTALPACRAVLLNHAMRELSAVQSLTTGKPSDELDAMRRVIALFGRGDLPVPDSAVRALIEKRMGRAVTVETLPELISQTAPLVFRVERTIELLDRVLGPAPREVLLKYLRFLFEQRDFAKELEQARDDVEAQKTRLDKLIHRLQESSVPQTRKEHFVEQLRLIAGRIGLSPTGRMAAASTDYVMFDGARVPLQNWSAVGLLFGPVTATLAPPQQVRLTVHVRTDRGPLQFDAEATVVRVQDGAVAAKYRCLKGADERIIQGHFTRRAQKK